MFIISGIMEMELIIIIIHLQQEKKNRFKINRCRQPNCLSTFIDLQKYLQKNISNAFKIWSTTAELFY